MVKVGIIGLGLIGASILKALHQNKKYELYCFSKSSYKKALEFCKNSSNEIEIVKNCDIIFVCCELSKTLETLEKLNNFLDKTTIVVDVASVKSDLLNKQFNFNFILSHPMAGTEFCGFDAGKADLFNGAKWLIEKNNEILEEIISDLSAKALKIDMNLHDKMCAEISHLPAILSFLLFYSTSNEAKQIASSGFRDTTRLAMTNSDLVFSMFKNNEKNILNSFNQLIQNLDYLKNLSDNEKINLFNELAVQRAKMYDNNGKNIFEI